MVKALIVDDEPGMRAVISKVITPHVDSVMQAEDGTSAIELFQKEHFDIVMLDIRLPDMDGPEILAAIRKMRPEVPVIMLSGFGDVETAIELVRLGAFDYISKPFKVDKLIQLVHAALGQGHPETASSDDLTGAPSTQRTPASAAASPSLTTSSSPTSSGSGKQKKTWPLVIGTGAAVTLLVGIGLFFVFPSKKELPTQTFAIPYTNPSALCWDGTHLWAGDWMEESIYKHVPDGSLAAASVFSVPGLQPTGLAFDGKNLWSSNSFERTIQKHKMDPSLTILATYPSPGPSISGLYYDGKSLWSVDFQEAKVYRHVFDEVLSVAESFESPAKNPCGLFKKGKSFFITDASSNIIYRVNAKTFEEQGSYMLMTYQGSSQKISAITFDGANIWSCSSGIGEITRQPFSNLKPQE